MCRCVYVLTHVLLTLYGEHCKVVSLVLISKIEFF